MSTSSPLPFSTDFFLAILHKPGVYLMLDAADTIIYVGKARDLKKRLASYARPALALPAKTAVMLTKVVRVDTILTASEKEALILEASLIKKHRPRYNVILRDDKNYPYIKVTIQEEWPRMLMTRRRVGDGARYFGPFASASAMWATLKYLNSIFPLRRCKGKKLQNRDRPCLNFQMGRCLAPCAGNVDRRQYMEMVENVVLALEGRSKELIGKLQEKMQLASESLKFEAAALYRDRIRAINKTLEKQVMVANHSKDQDIFALVRQETAIVISVISVRRGRVSGQQSFFLAGPAGSDPEILGAALSRYYSEDRDIPAEILTSIMPDDTDLLIEWLTDLRAKKVLLLVPQRGDRRQLLKMASANGSKVFAEQDKKKKSWQALGGLIKKELHLKDLPTNIECVDISNIGGKQAVGALVHFTEGEPDKSLYRHYKIRRQDTPDDYAMMYETLERRLIRGKADNNLPELLVLDGGKGQLNVAIAVLRELNLGERIELVAIAKEKQEEGEKLFRPNRKNPIIQARHSPVLLYLMRIRDESHRFGITFHRKLRSKKAFHSELDNIPGVGPARKKALLAQIGSLTKIKAASCTDLTEITGIGPELAQGIISFLHNGRGKK